MKSKYTSAVRQQQQIGELQSIKQKEEENVNEYTVRFNKLLKKVASDNNDLHKRFKINYFIQGLSPIIGRKMLEENPDTLAEVL